MESPPPKLPPKPPVPPEPKPDTWLSLFLTLTIIGGVLVGLVFVSMGSILGPLLLILLVLPAIALFHYLVWGWWLGKMLNDAAAHEDREQP